MTKDEARQQGVRTYDTGKPCKRGHVSNRYVSNSRCVACCEMDKVRLTRKAWRDANAEHVRCKDREYYRSNKQRISDYHRARYVDVLREKRLEAYVAWKNEQSTTIRLMYKDRNITFPLVYGTEDAYRQYVVWRIVNELDIPVRVEYSPTQDRRRGQIDIYLPTLNVGIEVKLEATYWSPGSVQRQVKKYEKWLGEGNVYVTSPGGVLGLLVDDVIALLKTRLSTLSE